jgi:hypothetical protein
MVVLFSPILAEVLVVRKEKHEQVSKVIRQKPIEGFIISSPISGYEPGNKRKKDLVSEFCV